ncbi:MAG: KEOPS complex kinase/ATPase Bud32 [Candidatus Nanoarchaeia archaeon]|nr:KEOPS complex kinase/ATPase Bud32 [Candidatus Nanoarchaeia archaeon]
MEILQQGAEAVIYKDKNKVIKHRIKKEYRINEIDEKLRKFRTKREAKVLEKIDVKKPKLISVDNKNMKIEMEFINGDLLKDIFDKLKNRKEICIKIGKQIRQMHNQNIIHGDLTTSNMILKNDEIYFIDFGLSFFSDKIEDKAVDLHLLKQAIRAKHYKVFYESFEEIFRAYHPDKEFMKRFEKVESRGRYKLRKGF